MFTCARSARLRAHAIAAQRAVAASRSSCADGPTTARSAGTTRSRRSTTSEIQVPLDADDMADIMYTSGTTGLPEGRARPPPQRRDDAELRAARGAARGWLHGAPLFTFAGMSFIFNPMKMGLTGLYMPKFDVDHWFDVVERDQPMMIFLVPAMAELVTASPRFDAADLSAPMAVSIGSAPLAPATLQAAPGPHAAGVGDRTRTASPRPGPRSSRCRKEEAAQAHRLGRQADAADGGQGRRSRHRRRRCDPNDVGELLVRLPGKRREYYKDDGANASDVDRRRLAAHRRPRVPRRRRLRVHLGSHQGHDHPRRQQHLRHRRRSGDPRARRRAGSGGHRRAAPGARRGRRRVRGAARRRRVHATTSCTRSAPTVSPTTSARASSGSSTSSPATPPARS